LAQTEAVDAGLMKSERRAQPSPPMSQPLKITSSIRLKDFNPGSHDGLEKEAAREMTRKLCERIGELQELLYANANQSVLIVLQGMDASGKDGATKRVLEFVNPAGTEVTSFKSPSHEELAHDFLWRIHKAVPRYGNIGVFNRSHYEEVLIVRVLKLKPEKVWKAHYAQINAFEKELVANRIVVLKFFLHISKEEQAERFRARIKDARKNWKYNPDDLKIREHWDEFQKAYEDAINRCSTTEAPWHVVPADHKWYRDYVIARTVTKAMEALKLKWPKPREDFSKVRIR
jgi:PPK2 family polyphosphate:nucleotide phosphotransferase